MGGPEPKPPTPDDASRHETAGDSWAGGPVAAALDRELKGSLPCVVCGYELQGLSIRGTCPECGTAVRATILFHVDPKADEFKPIAYPSLTAWSLVAWSLGALVATLAAWWPRIADLLARLTTHHPGVGPAPAIMILGIIVSGFASLGIARTFRGTPFLSMASALLGSLAYIPLAWAMWGIHAVLDAQRGLAPYFTGSVELSRLRLRMIVAACILIIILGLRPNARDLVRRSRAMRTGRIDRQTLLLLAAAMGVATIGDTLRYFGALQPGTGIDMYEVSGTLLVILGSGLFTLGVVEAVRDCWRLRRVILLPSPSLRQVLRSKPKA